MLSNADLAQQMRGYQGSVLSTKEIMEDLRSSPGGSKKLEKFASSVAKEDLNLAASTLGQAQTVIDTLNQHLTDASKTDSIPKEDLKQVLNALGVLVPKIPGLAGALMQSQDKIGGASGIKDLESSISSLEADKASKERAMAETTGVSSSGEDLAKSLSSAKDVESSIRAHKELNSLLSNFKVSAERLAANGVSTETLLSIGIEEAEIGSGSVGLLPLAVEAIKTNGKLTIDILEKSGVPPPIIDAIKTFKHTISSLRTKDKLISDFMIFDAIAAEINTVDKYRDPTEAEIRRALKTLSRINTDKYISGSIMM